MDHKTLTRALPALRQQLDQESKILAAQDFRHTVQKEPEKVADFIHRLERAFHITSGRDSMGKETREAFLFGLTERFNRTLKTMALICMATSGISNCTVCYGSTETPPQGYIGEALLLFSSLGRDCHYPTEAAFLPADEVQTVELTDYRQERAVALINDRDLAAQSIKAAKKKYKRQYDRIHKCSPNPTRKETWSSHDSPTKRPGNFLVHGMGHTEWWKSQRECQHREYTCTLQKGI